MYFLDLKISGAKELRGRAAVKAKSKEWLVVKIFFRNEKFFKGYFVEITEKNYC